MDTDITEPSPDPRWLSSLTDPVRDARLPPIPLSDCVRRASSFSLHTSYFPDLPSLFPPTTGDPAFDPDLIRRNVEKLRTVPEVRTGHPFLDLSVKTGLAHIDATFRGDHPKYGVKQYADECHDGFPPVIIAATDALSAWGRGERAAQLFRYWLLTFVRDDGTIRYRGASLAELGQLLNTASLLAERVGPAGWWRDGSPRLQCIVEWLLARRTEAEKDGGLLAGVPEDDEKDKVGTYFHNNAWVAVGLQRWAELCERLCASPNSVADRARRAGLALERDTLAAIRRCWPADAADWWLPPQLEPLERPGCMTGTREASYTNYRYWPELLSSGILPADLAHRVVDARLSGGGQFCGMTRFADWLDDWPLADYLYGLWRLRRKDDFLLSLCGHVSYHQAEGHLTAYEQVTFPPGREQAAYCLPCQLVAARAARPLVPG